MVVPGISKGVRDVVLDRASARASAPYIATLKSGLPEVRNNAGGHGEAPDARPVPSYIAAYALHLSAANIVMAVQASNDLSGNQPA
jgi:hypothetical protein